MLVHPKSKHRYIGHTQNFRKRKEQHWTELGKVLHGRKTDKKYRQMMKAPDPGCWIMLKLYIQEGDYVVKLAHRRRIERERLERDYIQRIRPTLNTMDIHKGTSTNMKRKTKKKWNNRRKNDKIRKPTEYTTFTVKKDKRVFLTLNSIAKVYPLHEKLTIEIKKGKKDLTRYEAIRHDPEIYKVNRIVKEIKTSETRKLKLKERHEKEPNRTEQMFTNIEIKELWNLPNDLLEKAYRARKNRWQNRKNSDGRSELRKYRTELRKICKNRFGRQPNEMIHFESMYHPDPYTQKRIMEYGRRMIEKTISHIPGFIRETIRIRAFVQKENTMGDELINMRKHSAQYDEKEQPTCLCYHPIFSNVNNENKGEHQVMRGSDATLERYRILRLHANSVAWPGLQDYENYFRNQEKTILGRLGNPKDRPHIRHISYPKNDYVTTIELRKIKRELQGLVISPVDRHKGEITIECPCRYHNTLQKMYETDEKVQSTKSEIMTKLKTEYKWTNIGRWNDKGDIPGPVYNMNKEKDINRQRPVRPSFKNPASKALRIAGRVVNYWISKAKIETRNWHIQDTLKLNEHIKREMNRIRIYGKHTRYVIRPGDIKNFFTLCDHEQALGSIKYLHGKVADKTQYYKVRKSGTAGVTNTTTGLFGDSKFQIITSAEVIDLITWSLQNQYYQQGKHIRKQKLGFPMGEAIAPPGANALATVALEEWAIRNPNEFRTTSIIRYVDDMLAIAAYDQRVKETKENARRTLAALFKDKSETPLGVFNRPLKIVDEPLNDDGSTNFLEAEIRTTDDGKNINIRYRRKNEDILRGKPNSKRLKLIVPYTSFGPKDRHIAKIYGMFKRIQHISPRRGAINERELGKSVRTFITECIHAGYPVHIFQRPLRCFSTLDDRWTPILKQVTAIRHRITTMYLGISQKLKRVKYKRRTKKEKRKTEKTTTLNPFLVGSCFIHQIVERQFGFLLLYR